MTRRLSVLIAVTIGWFAPVPGQAYPYFQRTSGTDTCNQCHISPSGAGLLTDWGRSEAGETLSRGGDGSFMHGAFELPEWLLLQGEFRVAALANDKGAPEGTEFAVFPMQTDLLAGLQFGEFSAVMSLGYRGQVRDDAPENQSNASTVDEPSMLSRFISREHYLMWQASGNGPYVRAGRFYAPYGLRVPNHNTYIRRYLGFNLLEETYGLSSGIVKANWEAHATAYRTDPFRGTGREETGLAGLYELRLGDHVLAGQSKLGFSDVDVRILAGAYHKLWFEDLKLLWMSEVDVGRQWFRDVVGGDRNQLVAYTGPVFLPIQGVYFGAAYELYDEDIAVKNVSRQAVNLWGSYWPEAHVEIHLSARAQWVGAVEQVMVTLLQVHYYL